MNYKIDTPASSLDRVSFDASSGNLLSVEDMIVLVGIQAMQFQQGKIQSQYQHIADQQALMKNLQKAIAAAAHTKTGRLDKIIFDYTDPATGKTVKMDLKTFMDRFGIESPKPEYHGIVKFIKDVIDGVGKLLGKVTDFIKAQFPELADTVDHIGKWVMDKIVKPLIGMIKDLDEAIGKFMQSDLGKALLEHIGIPLAILGAGVGVMLAAFVLAPVIGVVGAFAGTVIATSALVGLGFLTRDKIEKGEWDLYDMAKKLIGGIVDFLKAHLEEILENWTESLDASQWQEVEKNLKDTSDSAGTMAQQDHLRLSNALNEYNELTQMVSNNLNKITQMNLNVIGNMR